MGSNDVSFAYPGMNTMTLENLTLTIHPGTRVGLVGEGKSTSVKLLIGVLRPRKGTVERHSRLRLGYFDQHSVEILSVSEVTSISALKHFGAIERKA